MTTDNPINLEPQWLAAITECFQSFQQPYMQNLKQFLLAEKAAGYQLYPPSSYIFNAFWQTPFDQVKIVILGQDPYHGSHQANGLAFAVNRGIAIPPSLQNIYKELAQEYQQASPQHGDLSFWARQGVLLLNATLTVRANQAGSHQNQGWERFTDEIIRTLIQHKTGLVFLLWGSYAIRKAEFVDKSQHCVLTAPHPSPLSAHRGFFGCNHFRLANDYLIQQGQTPIDWFRD